MRHYKRQIVKRSDKRTCRTCNADISQYRENAKYCSRRCWTSSHTRYRIKRDPICRKCGQPVYGRRLVCDGCLIPKKSTWQSYIKNAKTLDEKMRRLERKKQAIYKHKHMVRAANAVYRELNGKPAKPVSPVSRTERSRQDYATYVAMREMNLLPRRNEL
jgi:hypothetical protein